MRLTTHSNNLSMTTIGTLTLLAVGSVASSALAQADKPTLFVANNGNLGGSVTTFTIEDDDTLTFIGTYYAATNATSIDLSPGGKWVAVGRAASAPVTQDLRIFGVNADGSLFQSVLHQTPKTPLDLAWINDDFLTVLRTNIETGSYAVILYELDDSGLTQRDQKFLTGFTSAVEVYPGRPFVYASESSGGNRITVFEFDEASKTLIQRQQVSAPAYPLGLAFSKDGRFLYAGGGISSGGQALLAYEVRNDGTLDPVLGMPFVSGGASPFAIACSDDNQFVFAGHGTDATVRVQAADTDGSLAYTGNFFDVGMQGTLGSIVSTRDLMFVTDESTSSDGIKGVYVFRFDGSGSLTQVGPVYDTLEPAPEKMVIWTPPAAACPGDLNNDGLVDADDLGLLLTAFGCSSDCDADLNSDGVVDADDLGILLGAFGVGC